MYTIHVQYPGTSKVYAYASMIRYIVGSRVEVTNYLKQKNRVVVKKCVKGIDPAATRWRTGKHIEHHSYQRYPQMPKSDIVDKELQYTPQPHKVYEALQVLSRVRGINDIATIGVSFGNNLMVNYQDGTSNLLELNLDTVRNIMDTRKSSLVKRVEELKEELSVMQEEIKNM